MTQEEIQQVQAYIAKLQADFARDMQTLQARHAMELQTERRARVLAQKENIQMGQAVHEIRKLCHTHATVSVEQIAIYAKQIIDRYCPDCDIPF